MVENILNKSTEFLEESQDLLVNILNNLKETLDIISQVDPKKQGKLESYILEGVNELSNILNKKIETIPEEAEFQVNSTIERLLLDNKLNFQAIMKSNANFK